MHSGHHHVGTAIHGRIANLMAARGMASSARLLAQAAAMAVPGHARRQP